MKTPGYINRNGQQLLRATDERGTDHNARIWILKCRNCLNIYGSNSTDAFERKCPKCQSGKPGLPVPIERDGQDWTHEEHLIAFQLYSRIPFGTIHMRNPLLIELAALLGRKIGSASRKLANFSRLDPVHQARGVLGQEPKDTTEWLTRFDGQRLILPKKFAPSSEFLEKHAAKCRAKAC